MADTDVKQTVISTTVDYLKGQPFNNVLLTALVALVALAAGYGLPWAVREAKSGARELIQDCKTEREEREKRFSESLKELGATFERTLDRVEGRKPADPPRGNGLGLDDSR
jgi:ribosomal protein L12E/L44/L45/RPP1/RPP2